MDDRRDPEPGLLDQVALDRVGGRGHLDRAEVRRPREPGDLADPVAARAAASRSAIDARRRRRPRTPRPRSSWATFSVARHPGEEVARRARRSDSAGIAVGERGGGLSSLHRPGGQAADQLALGEQVEDERRHEGERRVGEDRARCRSCTGSRSWSRRAAASSSIPSDSITSGSRNWFQLTTMASTATVARTGRDSGSRIRQKNPNGPQPSIAAASSSSFGMLRKNGRRMMIVERQRERRLGQGEPERVVEQPEVADEDEQRQDRDRHREQQAQREQRVQRPRGRGTRGGRTRTPPAPRTGRPRPSTGPR